MQNDVQYTLGDALQAALENLKKAVASSTSIMLLEPGKSDPTVQLHNLD